MNDINEINLICFYHSFFYNIRVWREISRRISIKNIKNKRKRKNRRRKKNRKNRKDRKDKENDRNNQGEFSRGLEVEIRLFLEVKRYNKNKKIFWQRRSL